MEISVWFRREPSQDYVTVFGDPFLKECLCIQCGCHISSDEFGDIVDSFGFLFFFRLDLFGLILLGLWSKELFDCLLKLFTEDTTFCEFQGFGEMFGPFHVFRKIIGVSYLG